MLIIARCRVQWLILVILASQEAQIGKMPIRGQSMQKVHETSCQPVKVGVVVHTCHPN
jgi:hypothetical protein